jgi:hypothetical protein
VNQLHVQLLVHVRLRYVLGRAHPATDFWTAPGTQLFAGSP